MRKACSITAARFKAFALSFVFTLLLLSPSQQALGQAAPTSTQAQADLDKKVSDAKNAQAAAEAAQKKAEDAAKEAKDTLESAKKTNDSAQTAAAQTNAAQQSIGQQISDSQKSMDAAKADAASASDTSKASAKTTSDLVQTANKKATEAIAAAGVALNGSTNVKDNVRVQAVLLPHDSATKVFGKQIANHYAIIQVIVDNESETSSFLLQSLFMDYSGWALSGMVDDLNQPSDCRDIPRLGPSQVATCSGQVASIEYRVIRGQLQDASVWSGRNTVVRIAVFAGSVSTGLAGLKSKTALGYSSSYSGDFIPALQILWPDPTEAQVNRVSDFGFQTNKIFPKGSADVVYAFFPIQRFLSPGLKHLFLNAPALFFSPAQFFFDTRIDKKSWLKKVRGTGIREDDIEDTKDLVRNVVLASVKAASLDPISEDNFKQAAWDRRASKFPTIKDKEGKEVRDDQTLDAFILSSLLSKCDDSEANNGFAKLQCSVKEAVNRTSLNQIHVVAGGVMSVNTQTVPATLEDVNFALGNHSADLWSTPKFNRSGTVTGTFLTDGSVTVSKLTGPEITGNLADYFDTLPFPSAKTGASDTSLPFSMMLKKAIPSGSTIQFQVIKSTWETRSPQNQSRAWTSNSP